MLLDLHVHDMALIQEADVALGPGMNALTGETGAGKSLLVTALELLLGERPRGGRGRWVREGSERALVEGRFALAAGPLADRVRAHLAECLPAVAEDCEGEELELILGRTVDVAGRSRAHVNERPVPLRALAQVAHLLFEIHGQNTHQRLLEPDCQRDLLDAFAELDGKRARYQQARRRWRSLVRRIEALEQGRAEREARADVLRHHIDELDALDVQPGEEQTLGEERTRLRHAGELARELSRWIHALSDADDSVLDRTRQVERGAMVWAGRIAELKGACAELLEARLHLEEASSALLRFADGVQVDPDRLEEVEARLAAIEKLTLKHRVPADGLVEHQRELEAELTAWESERDGLDGLRAEAERARAALTRAARTLSKGRRAAAGPLAEAMVPSLVRLGLRDARFEVRFVERDEGEGPFGPSGSEEVEFQLGANPGEPLRPLAQVASGGEAARVMLALRSALAGCETGRMLVFDEIDSGVGGRLAPEVARHLRELGTHHQVLSVTHLPAIAAASHRHLVVCKRVVGGRTRTSVEPVEGEERVREVADMIAGGGGEETARAEARRLLRA